MLTPALTPEQLDELQALYEKATPGEWIADDNEGFSAWTIWAGMTPSGHGTPGPIIAEIAEIHGDGAKSDVNADLIAALHNAFPALLAAARRGMENGRDAEKWREYIRVQAAARRPGAMLIRLSMVEPTEGKFYENAHGITSTELGDALADKGRTVEKVKRAFAFLAMELLAAIDEARGKNK